MESILDNPAWSALISGNQHFSQGNETVKYFPSEISPFVALKEISEENFSILHSLVPPERVSLLISQEEITMPANWKALQSIMGFQMIYRGDAKPVTTKSELVPLTDEHIPEMLALTKLTNPGPFAERTIDFGYYYGIFEDGRLAAMAGQRMHPLPFAEISAVCTHPDYTGRGYARELLLFHVNRIKAAGEIPILHVRYNNDRAVSVYKDLGFAIRREIYFNVIQKI